MFDFFGFFLMFSMNVFSIKKKLYIQIYKNHIFYDLIETLIISFILIKLKHMYFYIFIFSKFK